MRNLPVVTDHITAIRMIANNMDIWQEGPVIEDLIQFRQLYLEKYSSFPTNTQFVERGVKESGFVALGRRDEKNRTILALSRSKILPEVLSVGRALLNLNNNGHSNKKKQLQGKTRTKVLMRQIKIYSTKMD